MSTRGFYVALGLGVLLGAASFSLAQEERSSPFAKRRKLPGALRDLLRVTDDPGESRPASAHKAAVPAAADQAELLAKIKEVVDRPKSNAERAKLSGEMLDAGSSERDKPTRYVLFRYAGSLALEAKDLKGALAAVDRLERDYDVDALTMKAEVLDRLLARDTATEVLAAAQQAYGEAIDRDHYDAAVRLGGVAYAAAQRLKKRDLTDELKRRAGRLSVLKSAFDAIRPAIATLKETPDDVDANRRLGEYLCFSKGDLPRGLPLLVKGKHELAQLDRSAPIEADAQRRLGDGWWDLASTHNGLVRTVLQQHAADWYRRALPQLKGLNEIRAQKRINVVAKVAIRPNEKVAVRPKEKPGENEQNGNNDKQGGRRHDAGAALRRKITDTTWTFFVDRRERITFHSNGTTTIGEGRKWGTWIAIDDRFVLSRHGSRFNIFQFDEELKTFKFHVGADANKNPLSVQIRVK